MSAAPLAAYITDSFKGPSSTMVPCRQMEFNVDPSSWSSSASSYTSNNTSEDAFNESSSGPDEELPSGTAWEPVANSIVLRESHDNPDSPYCLPADNDEKLRLDKQHSFIRDHICNGRLVLDEALRLENGALVLDLGTGSGAWASDLAQFVPAGVKIQGFDISNRLFPPNASNVTFAIGNVLDLPDHLRSRVTLAHQRLLIYALRRHEWSHAIASIKDTLIPGQGVVQLTEVLTPADNPGAAQEKFQALLSSIGHKRQLLLDCGELLPVLLSEAGFVDIEKKTVKVRLGTAGGLKGVKAAACRGGAFRGMRDSVLFDGGYGIVNSAEEFDKLVDQVMIEWETNECYAFYYTITARRPASVFTTPPSPVSKSKMFDVQVKRGDHLPLYQNSEDRAATTL
ncbi:methyltransferase domain-containing protein [Colletotrichum incanum]|uniref:Methyltransferase domain-containing protein n=1 Tax=Colletotrichum incanum TaxID=1573173 RepID=A0A166ZUR3_COLIC|nr:methyltransferase domain-containing protein [Colletotrichum incanum]OHX00491.1 s-adenosyl-l-methionine-dependent methyltransferase [Colletotrichum incanum]